VEIEEKSMGFPTNIYIMGLFELWQMEKIDICKNGRYGYDLDKSNYRSEYGFMSDLSRGELELIVL
jgi:hypothetical protein